MSNPFLLRQDFAAKGRAAGVGRTTIMPLCVLAKQEHKSGSRPHCHAVTLFGCSASCELYGRKLRALYQRRGRTCSFVQRKRWSDAMTTTDNVTYFGRSAGSIHSGPKTKRTIFSAPYLSVFLEEHFERFHVVVEA